MKMYLISDNIDTWTGMRLAGVEGAVVHEKEELKAELDKVLADKTIGIVLLTEKFGRDLKAGQSHVIAQLICILFFDPILRCTAGKQTFDHKL